MSKAAVDPVYWKGPVPERCDLCSARIRGVFVDGSAVGDLGNRARWAIMDPACHRKRGQGFGPGRAQQFRLQADGRFLKTKG